jgi:hypothetical protein
MTTIHRSVSTNGNEISIIITDFKAGVRQITIEYDPEKPALIRVNNRIITIGG